MDTQKSNKLKNKILKTTGPPRFLQIISKTNKTWQLKSPTNHGTIFQGFLSFFSFYSVFHSFFSVFFQFFCISYFPFFFTILSRNYLTSTLLDYDCFVNITIFSSRDLRNNALKRLSSMVFSDMISLRSLRLDGNRLEAIEENVFVGTVKSLAQLTLDDNRLAKVPHGIRGLRKIKHLSIKRNLITNLPNLCFTDLINLQFL